MLIYAQGGRLGTENGGLALPATFTDQGAQFTGRRPCLVWYRGDLYVIGYYTRPVVRHRQDTGEWRLAGIKPPSSVLSVVPGASAGGSSGACLAAITFLHKAGPVVLAESDFGNVVDVGQLTGEGRVWSGIDAGSAEARVTHVRGYVSMDGAGFRAAWEAQYGITAYVENVRTAQLTYVGPNYDHGIPPDTRFGCEWQGRMWYASSPKHPYRLWRSLAGQPQYVAPTSYLDTLGKEEITGIAKGRNELVVFCLRNSYMIRQFGTGEDDFVVEKLDSDVGCISHFGISEIHNKLWFPSEDGIWIYDGGFRYLMKQVQPLWRADWESNKQDFLSGFALHDRINKIYMWVTRRPDRLEFENTDLEPGTMVYCGYYGEFEPSMAGSGTHPEWTLDMKDRFDSSGFYDEDGELVIGSCDGIIRKQDWTEGTDDGDALQKELIIRTGCWLFNEPGDNRESGKQLHDIWSYIEAEVSAWSLHVRGGDEKAWRSLLPDNELHFWKTDVAASAVSETRTLKLRSTAAVPYLLTYVPKTVHYHVPQKVTGRGFFFEYRSVAPVAIEYRGTGGMWSPGSVNRGVETAAPQVVLALSLEYSDDAGANWTPLGEVATIAITSAVPAALRFRASGTYLMGSPTFPITVTITNTEGLTVTTEQIPLTQVDPTMFESADISYTTGPGPGGVTTIAAVTAADGAGIVASNPHTITVTVTEP